MLNEEEQKIFAAKVTNLLHRLENNNIGIDHFSKENQVDFKIRISKQESELEKKVIVLYIDVAYGKTYVIEAQQLNKFGNGEKAKVGK